jgi:hypothetical protein
MHAEQHIWPGTGLTTFEHSTSLEKKQKVFLLQYKQFIKHRPTTGHIKNRNSMQEMPAYISHRAFVLTNSVQGTDS